MTPQQSAPQRAATSGTVHWVGVGLSTARSGLEWLAQRADRVVFWGRDQRRLDDRMAALDLTQQHERRQLTPQALAAALRPGDILVSMAPAAEHPALLRAAIDAGAHFACTSYTSPTLAELAGEAERAGLVVLTEAGLDPGIDHLMAHALVARAREAVGEHAAPVRFTSHCGGIPEHPGEFRYRFSWAPVGVLTALRSPATYVQAGREVTAARPWESVSTYDVGGETFEVYPNRDSLPFRSQYGFPSGWQLQEFVRGTLRPAGWRDAWAEVFAVVQEGDEERIRATAADLAQRYPTGPRERDRVVLTVRLEVGDWWGEYTLDLLGGEQESAMARCVTAPLVCGIDRMLGAALEPGLHRAAARPDEVELWLTHLEQAGLPLRVVTA